MGFQIVSYKIALLAKSKGFGLKNNKNNSVSVEYPDNVESWYDAKMELQSPWHYDEGISSYVDNNTINTHCFAPFQELLQQWLREKHKVYIAINITSSAKILKTEVFYALIVFDGDEYKLNEFSDYDLCLENALIKGLSFINY